MYVCMVRTYVCPAPGVLRGNALVQNGVSGRYTHTVFELVAHEESIINMDKSITYFYQGRLTTAPRLVGFVWPLASVATKLCPNSTV